MDLNVSGGFSHAAVDFRPTLNGDQREELLYEGLLNYATDNGMESPAVTTVLHSMPRSATTVRKDWPKTPVWTVTLHV